MHTRQIHVGRVIIGGGAPVVVQSMTNTDTRDPQATLAQIDALAKAGCQVVRCAVPDMQAAHALGEICEKSPLPVVADIHFLRWRYDELQHKTPPVAWRGRLEIKGGTIGCGARFKHHYRIKKSAVQGLTGINCFLYT